MNLFESRHHSVWNNPFEGGTHYYFSGEITSIRLVIFWFLFLSSLTLILGCLKKQLAKENISNWANLLFFYFLFWFQAIFSQNLLEFYLSCEGLGLTTLLMLVLPYRSSKSSLTNIEQAFIYFFWNALAGFFFAFGIWTFLNEGWGLSFDSIHLNSTSTNKLNSSNLIDNWILEYSPIYETTKSLYPTIRLIDLGCFSLALGFLFKLGLFPCHFWVANLYAAAPLALTTLLATLSKVPIIIFFYNFWFKAIADLSLLGNIQHFFMYAGILSLIVGASGAFNQMNLKRFIAYSSINQLAYILLAAISYNSTLVYFFLASYLIASINIFSFLLANESNLSKVTDLATYPFSALNLLVGSFSALMSLMGFPPFLGFYAKKAVLISLIWGGHSSIAILVSTLALISGFYYLKILIILYIDKYYINISRP